MIQRDYQDYQEIWGTPEAITGQDHERMFKDTAKEVIAKFAEKFAEKRALFW